MSQCFSHQFWKYWLKSEELLSVLYLWVSDTDICNIQNFYTLDTYTLFIRRVISGHEYLVFQFCTLIPNLCPCKNCHLCIKAGDFSMKVMEFCFLFCFGFWDRVSCYIWFRLNRNSLSSLAWPGNSPVIPLLQSSKGWGYSHKLSCLVVLLMPPVLFI